MWLTPKRIWMFQLIKKYLFRKISFGMKWKQGLWNAVWPYIAPHFRLFLAIAHSYGKGLWARRVFTHPILQGRKLPFPPSWSFQPGARHLGELRNCSRSPLAACAQHQNAPVNTSANTVSVKQLLKAWQAPLITPTQPDSAVRLRRPQWRGTLNMSLRVQ